MSVVGSASEQGLNKPERNPNGTLKKGSTANPAGRRALPDLYTALTPVALAVQAALATGVVVAELIPDELPEAKREQAKKAIEDAAKAGDKDPDLRGKHADMMISRVHGKPKEQVEHSGEVGSVTELRVTVVRPAPEKVVEGVTVKKAITARDAE